MKISDVYKDVEAAKSRVESLRSKFEKSFDNGDNLRFFSCPGRSEIIGNHTDHQGGCVIACSIELDILACVSVRDDRIVRIKSDDYLIELDLSLLEKQTDEVATSAGLVRGVAAGLAGLGAKICGFDAVFDSTVPPGSGLSSSAAFSVLVGKILSSFAGFEADYITLAKNAKFAENVYFEKPCGLMDQIACACGGMVFIDFKNAENPAVEQIECDLKSAGLNPVITNTGGSHADLTDAYAEIPADMRMVAQVMGCETLSECDADEFFNEVGCDDEGDVPEPKVPARAYYRAAHYFDECERVKSLKKFVKKRDFKEFLRIINASGHSSVEYLGNVFVPNNDEQNLAAGLEVSARFLKRTGAVRVHGGGFAGTILAFVPNEILPKYIKKMNKLFGADAAIVSDVRDAGVCEIFV